MWGILTRISRLPHVGAEHISHYLHKETHRIAVTVPKLLHAKSNLLFRGYGIRFTPRSLLVGRFLSPLSNRLPCLSENPNSSLNQSLIIDLGLPTKKWDVPQRMPPNPLTAPTVTVITDYQHYKEINEVSQGLKEIIAPEYQKFKKYAARLIVIRRRKMKKHKLKKLRKRMKFLWAKVRQRRELRKEKAFQATLLEEIRLAEKFNAEEWALDCLRRAKETPIVRKPRKTQQEIMIGKYGRVLDH